MKTVRPAFGASLAALLILSLVARSGQAAEDTTPSAEVAALGYQEMTIQGADYAFEGVPETIEAGYTLITLEDTSQDIHHAQLVKLNEGVTMEQVETALPSLEADPAAVFALVTLVGGLGIIAPGGTAQVILNLDPGQYVWICGLPAPDGELHFQKGMIQAFEVVPAAEETAAEPPAADATLTLKDFAFDGLPEPMTPGPQIWEVVNDGPEPHEFLLFQLAPGVSAEEFLMAMEGPEPPGLPVGGMQGLAPGLTGWLVLDLAPGNYLAVCFIPSPAHEGQAHLELGMLAEFTVAEA